MVMRFAEELDHQIDGQPYLADHALIAYLVAGEPYSAFKVVFHNGLWKRPKNPGPQLPRAGIDSLKHVQESIATFTKMPKFDGESLIDFATHPEKLERWLTAKDANVIGFRTKGQPRRPVEIETDFMEERLTPENIRASLWVENQMDPEFLHNVRRAHARITDEMHSFFESRVSLQKNPNNRKFIRQITNAICRPHYFSTFMHALRLQALQEQNRQKP